MNLFDKLVSEALKNQPNLTPLQVVVEKELLHQDILRILSQANLLKDLTFIGGTCLRCCYGGIRLSEDLDFNGGKNFTRITLASMGNILVNSLQEKYGLLVVVSEPIKDKNNVDTWKISVQTRPERRDMPAQRINIDICAATSYEKLPMLLLNPYGVDMGISGLILQAQSREEIYIDKMIAFAFRPNRIKFRDLWDMAWLHQQNLKPRFSLLPKKLLERQKTMIDFLQLYTGRLDEMKKNRSLENDFKQEISRFLPQQTILGTNLAELWTFIIYLLDDLKRQCQG